MVAHVGTVAFQGIDALAVDVQVQLASGLPAFTIVGMNTPILTSTTLSPHSQAVEPGSFQC